MKKKLKNVIWITIGLLSFTLGTIGIVLPLLPTVPFYMAAAFSFAKSSEKLHEWLIGTKLYKRYIKEIVHNKAMTMKKKISVLTGLTLFMGVGFFFMKNAPIGRLCIAIVWIGHIFYFMFKIKTLKTAEIITDSNNI